MFLSDTSIRERLVPGDNLNKKEIIALLNKGHIVLSPFPTEEILNDRFGSCAFDLELGTTIRESVNPRVNYQHHNGQYSISHQTVDFRKEDTLDDEKHPFGLYELEEGSEFVLEPKALIQAVTRDFIGIPSDLVGFIHSRSRCGRYGISSSYDAPKIDPGWVGQIVLEVSNMGPRRFSLHPGLRICQIMFAKLDQPSSKPYYSRKNASWRWQSQP